MRNAPDLVELGQDGRGEGTFPARHKISVNGAGWHESEINRWIANPAGWRPRGEFDFDDF